MATDQSGLRSRQRVGQTKPRAQGLATQVTATTLTSRSRQRVGQTKPRAQGLATLVTAPTERVSQAWHVYASTRTLSVSGCTREQETRRLEDTQRSRAEVGCDTATTGGYRPVCFDKQNRVSVKWRLSGTLASIAI